MPTADTISFPNFDPVTGQPTIDGFTGDFDPGLVTPKTEPGFAEADQVAFDGGSLAPPVVLKCERVVNPAGRPAGDYLALSFFCSFDMSFNDQDVVVIAVKSAGGATQADARRIDVHPVRNGIGAGAAADSYTDPATWTPLGVDGMGNPIPGTNYLRVDYAPRATNVWKGNPAFPGAGATRWLTASLPNLYARCSSWRPASPGATLTADASLATSPATFSIQVDSTAGFPQSGVLVVVVGGSSRLVSYASKTATSFDGCTQSGAAATVPAGTTIVLSDVGWAIEVLVPRTAALGGADWIDLNDGFGLYADIIRWGTEPGAGPHIHAGSYATQYMFPVPELGAARHNITGSLGDNTPIDLSWYGTAFVPALQTPPGSNLGVGVRFQNTTNPEWSVGVRDKTLAAWSPLGTTVQGQTGTFDNRLVAQLRNTAALAAGGVTAVFRFANWGLPPASFPAWAPAIGADPPSVVNLTAAGGPNDQDEVTSVWDRANVPAGYGASKHQCIWVQLTTTGGSAVHFVQGGVRRNMDFANLSDLEQEFEVSGQGYEGGGDREFLLFPHVRQILVPGRPEADATMTRALAPAREFKRAWVWLVDGLRRTGETVTIEGETAEILDPSPGQFGVVATHDEPGDALGYRIFGKGIEWQGGGYLSVTVPDGGTVKGTVQLHAGPPAEVAKFEELDRRGVKRVSCQEWLIAVIRRVLGR